MVDGGWWEGSLNGEVGWFPSNFVKDFGVIDTGIETKRTSNILSMIANEEDFTHYKTVVEGLNFIFSSSFLDPIFYVSFYILIYVLDIVNSEANYLQEIRFLTDNLLVIVRKSQKLKPNDVELVCR